MLEGAGQHSYCAKTRKPDHKLIKELQRQLRCEELNTWSEGTLLTMPCLPPCARPHLIVLPIPVVGGSVLPSLKVSCHLLASALSASPLLQERARHLVILIWRGQSFVWMLVPPPAVLYSVLLRSKDLGRC